MELYLRESGLELPKQLNLLWWKAVGLKTFTNEYFKRSGEKVFIYV